jgi:uncharacterized protein
MKPVSFGGSWVLVTGASSGLGSEFARKLAHRGANLILSARSHDKLVSLAADLTRINGVETRVVSADLTSADGIQFLLSAVDGFGLPVEHVINNAGFGAVGDLTKTDLETHRRMVRLNVEALTAISRHFLPHMLAIGRGGILHVASTSAYQPTPFMATYGATKAFVLSFSLALSEETRGTGVRVTALCPGPVPTGFQDAAGIRQQGMMGLVKVDAPKVVDVALRGYDAGRPFVIPGTLNSLQTTASKLLPQSLITRCARWAMQNLGRT